jgi:oxygen-independent coproporphyrinogen III oxidase
MTLGIYTQVPFCQSKCTYCNFHTGVVSRERYAPYVEAVCREISTEAPQLSATFESGSGSLDLAPKVARPEVDTVYFGGGTPSLLDPAALARILARLREKFRFADAPECTLEADPETITLEKAAAWRAAGFNRISLGSQSFNDSELKSAGRMHRRADIHNAAEFLRAAGIHNISFDLIAGLPHQTRESWHASLTELLTLRPEHVSVYMLEIDEGSRLGRESLAQGNRYGAPAIPSDDAMADFYESACRRLAGAGYGHYEISNWALPGFASRHNLKYWRREPYLGLGAGAHSFDGRTRWANVHDSARYVALMEQGISPREQMETVTPEQSLDEEFFLGLRQLEGIDLARIQRDYATAGLRERVSSLIGRIDALQSQGLVERQGSRLRLAPARLAVSNEVFVELMG